MGRHGGLPIRYQHAHVYHAFPVGQASRPLSVPRTTRLTPAALSLTEDTILQPPDSDQDDDFGGAVAIDGNTAIVGAPEQDVEGKTNQGAAYVFIYDGTSWSPQAKLLGSDSDALDHFGSSVAIAGDTAVVGGNIGNVAYVFVRTGASWAEQAKLTAPGVGSVDGFGVSVALSGTTIMVGALRDHPNGGTNGPGTAFVFVRDGDAWNLQATLFADDGENSDEFGRAVALDGDLAVIGASAYDLDGQQNAGAAYVFVRTGTTWTQEAKLVGSDMTAFDQFGWSVALSGDTALVGARSGNGAIDQAGVAYVFRRSGTTWSQEAKLLPQNEEPLRIGGSRFGHAVSLLGNVALVGAPRTDVDGLSDAGVAYVFERIGSTWHQAARLTALEAQDTGEFGGAVALAPQWALVGASEQFSTFFGANAAYPFKLNVCPVDGDVNHDGQITPADALLAFRAFFAHVRLNACQQVRANVAASGVSVTPKHALCILQKFLKLPSYLD